MAASPQSPEKEGTLMESTSPVGEDPAACHSGDVHSTDGKDNDTLDDHSNSQSAKEEECASEENQVEEGEEEEDVEGKSAIENVNNKQQEDQQMDCDQKEASEENMKVKKNLISSGEERDKDEIQPQGEEANRDLEKEDAEHHLEKAKEKKTDKEEQNQLDEARHGNLIQETDQQDTTGQPQVDIVTEHKKTEDSTGEEEGIDVTRQTDRTFVIKESEQKLEDETDRTCAENTTEHITFQMRQEKEKHNIPEEMERPEDDEPSTEQEDRGTVDEESTESPMDIDHTIEKMKEDIPDDFDSSNSQGKAESPSQELGPELKHSDSQDQSNVSSEDASSNRSGCKIWLMGDGYIRRVEERARRTTGVNLGLNAQVHWFGQSGMQWCSFIPFFHQTLQGRPAPDILLIHCGSNDLGHLKTLELVGAMKRDLSDLSVKFPQIKIILSAVAERPQWVPANSGKINKARKWVNKVMSAFVLGFEGIIVHHPHITFDQPGLFLNDGVNFSSVGNDIFLNDISLCLKDLVQ